MNALPHMLQEAKYGLEKEIHPLRSLTVEVTRGCNLSCRHCYASAAPGFVAEMSLGEIEALAAKLRREHGRSVHIRLTGGEPLTRPDILWVIDSFRDQGFPVTLVSNGILLTEGLAPELAKRLAGISISLDGLEEAHNYLRGAPAFVGALEAIRRMVRAGAFVGVKTTAYRKNIGDMEGLHALVLSLGVRLWHVFPMEPSGRGALHRDLLLSAEEFSALRSQMRELARDRGLSVLFGEEGKSVRKAVPCPKMCAAGITQAAILHDGSIVGCVCADRRRPPEGNIQREDFTKTWEEGFGSNRTKEYRDCGNHVYV